MALRNILAIFDVRVKHQPIRRAIKEVDKYTRTVRKGARATDTLTRSTGGLGRAFARLASDFKVLGAAYLGFQGIKGLVTLSDEYVSLQNRLRVVTDGTEEFQMAQREMFRVARDTRQPVKNVTEMFQRYSIATKSLGTSQADVIKLSTALIKGTLLSGTSAESARGSIIQLAQGLGTNFEAAGQEIRSIQENAPLLAQIIAKAAGGTSDQLMKLAKDGKITSKLVVKAILDAGIDLDKQFAERQVLLSEGATRLRTVALKSLGLFNAWSKASSTLAKGLTGIANAVERIIDSNWTENFINLAWVGAILAGVSALAGLVSQLHLVAAWGVVFVRMAGGWIVAFKQLAIVIGRFLVRFLLIPLIIEDFIGFLRGNRSFLGDALAEMFGKQNAQEILDTTRNVLMSIVDMFRIAWAWITGDALDAKDQGEMDKRSKQLMKAFDKLGTWLENKAIQIGKNIRIGLFGDFGSAIESFTQTGEAADSQANAEISNLVNSIFGTNFGTAKKVSRSGTSQADPQGSTSPFARGTEADFNFMPVPRVNSGGGSRNITISDNRTTTINATSGGAGAQQIATAASVVMDRDRRAIAAATGVAQ